MSMVRHEGGMIKKGREKSMEFKEEHEFILPIGYKDTQGRYHHYGKMRLSTAKDELMLIRHPKVRQSSEYEKLILLSHVITHLEGCEKVTLEIIESLYLIDINYLLDLYHQINQYHS